MIVKTILILPFFLNYQVFPLDGADTFDLCWSMVEHVTFDTKPFSNDSEC